MIIDTIKNASKYYGAHPLFAKAFEYIQKTDLNTIEMGKGIFGIEEAGEQYFHKHAKDLSRNEAAMIVACLPNPKIYSVKPVSRFVEWKSNWILRQMNNVQNDKNIRDLIYKK